MDKNVDGQCYKAYAWNRYDQTDIIMCTIMISLIGDNTYK